MSAKIIGPYKPWDAASLGASTQTSAIDVTRLIYASIAIDWTGTPTGTIQLQAKNGDSSWIDITGQSQALAGSSGAVMFSLTILPWEQIRLAYARTSGTGTITANLIAKGW
jgi:hypothetical protein